MEDTSQRCRLCGTEKPLDEFYYRKDSSKHRSECKDCIIEMVKYRAYGVCNVKYHEMLTIQHGKCAVCESTLNGSRYSKLAIDHDHKTGKVRGLLCSNCNTAIGLLKDSPRRCRSAAEYLARHGCEDIV